MLELTEQQLAALDELEERQFVKEVQGNLLREHPELASDEGLYPRLQKAHACALRLGFTQRSAIAQFLYTEAFAPNFHEQPAIAAWLHKPIGGPEERFADLLAVMKLRLKEVA